MGSVRKEPWISQTVLTSFLQTPRSLGSRCVVAVTRNMTEETNGLKSLPILSPQKSKLITPDVHLADLYTAEKLTISYFLCMHDRGSSLGRGQSTQSV